MQFIIHVSVVLTCGGRIALVHERKPQSHGKWNLPGGHLEPGEALVAGAERELREETGQAVSVGGYLGVYTGRDAKHAFNFIFTAETEDESLRPPPDELLGAGWFSVPDILTMPDERVLNPRKLRRILTDFRTRGPHGLDCIGEDLYGA